MAERLLSSNPEDVERFGALYARLRSVTQGAGTCAMNMSVLPGGGQQRFVFSATEIDYPTIRLGFDSGDAWHWYERLCLIEGSVEWAGATKYLASLHCRIQTVGETTTATPIIEEWTVLEADGSGVPNLGARLCAAEGIVDTILDVVADDAITHIDAEVFPG